MYSEYMKFKLASTRHESRGFGNLVYRPTHCGSPAVHCRGGRNLGYNGTGQACLQKQAKLIKIANNNPSMLAAGQPRPVLNDIM